jgi:uncharacterized membrane protein
LFLSIILIPWFIAIQIEFFTYIHTYESNKNKIGQVDKTRIQSYDCELQRQPCRWLEIVTTQQVAECNKNQKYFPLLCKNTLAYFSARVVVVNAEVVGLAPGSHQRALRKTTVHDT